MTAKNAARTRVLVVEDSRVIAEFLTHVLQSDPQLQVVETASNGEEAVLAVQRVKPDVITMDIHMPGLNGFDATRKIMETRPTPIVIVSGSFTSDEMAMNFHAVEAGALALVARPVGPGHPDFERSTRELIDTVKLMSEVKVVRRWPRTRPLQNGLSSPPAAEFKRAAPGAAPEVVAIGASTGGPMVLQTLLSGLPKPFPIPLLIVQHMSHGFAPGFVEWLGRASGFPVSLARHGEYLQAGRAYVAPDDVHLGLQPGRCALLSKAPAEHGMRPAVSFLFRAVAATFGARAVGILLTGMGRDGADALLDMKSAGALTIAQDFDSSVVHGMPGEAIRTGAAMLVLSPEGIVTNLKTISTRT